MVASKKVSVTMGQESAKQLYTKIEDHLTILYLGPKSFRLARQLDTCIPTGPREPKLICPTVWGQKG